MKNNLQQKAADLHQFVAGYTQSGKYPRENFRGSVKAMGVRLVQLAYDPLNIEQRANLEDIEHRARMLLSNDYDLGQPTVTEVRTIFKTQSKAFEARHQDKEANFCRMCSELFRVFDTTDFSQSSGLPRACVKAWYAGADYDAIKHAVMLLF